MLDSHEGKNKKYGIKHRNLGFISKRKGTSGNITEWVDFAMNMKKPKNNYKAPGWKLVAAPGYNIKSMGNLSPGDILIYKNGPLRTDTGHVMIALKKPNTWKGAIFSLDIADSTKFPKYNDERSKDHPKNKNKKMKKNATGMGKGTIHLRKNKAGLLQMDKHMNGKDWTKLYVVRPV